MDYKYYVVRVKYLKDGTEKRIETMAYDTKQQAIAKFHNNLSTDMVDDTLRGSMCTVLNYQGGQVEREYWEIEEPEPEPNEGE